MMKIFFYHIFKCGKNEDIFKMKCWVCFLPRYKAVRPGPSSRASKQGEKSLPPQSCDLPGLWWFSGDVTGWHDSVLLCHHRCGFVGLCEAPRHPHRQGRYPGFQLYPVYLPPPALPLLLTLHQSSQDSHLQPPTDRIWNFPESSVGKEFTGNAGDPSSIPGLGRSTGEGNGNPLQYSWASLVAQLVKNPPAMWETWVSSLAWEDPLERGKATHSSILAWRNPWTV